MGFKCGIVGLPNVGKSTLFNALTQSCIAAENYPFCTIDPNVGVVPVPDTRLDQLAAIVKPQKIIPTSMEFVDIAGLVEGAAKGEGLGNQFLAHIRETEAIAHVVRCFENDDIIHVAGSVDPKRDVTIIQSELILADLQTIEKALLKNKKTAKSGDKVAQAEMALLQQVEQELNNNIPARSQDLSLEEIESLKKYGLITLKPLMYIANVDDSFDPANPWLAVLKDIAAAEQAPVVVVSAAIEAELIEITDPEEKSQFLADLGLTEPGLNQVIRNGYGLLDLQTYFTAGEKEVRAWTFPTGARAPQAAGKIHTDFEKGFIRAEVIKFEDYINYKGESGCKDAGKWRLEGKEYVVQDGDVIHFRFNV